MEELTILEAVDNLSSMAELDTLAGEKGEAGGEVLERGGPRQWLGTENLDKKQETIRQTFKVMYDYLRHVLERSAQLKDAETQKGIQAMMALAAEAARKIDAYGKVFKGVSVTNLKEYQQLQQLYLGKIVPRFHEELAPKEEWEEALAVEEPQRIDIEQRGLKDLEMVRRDAQYELFHIRREDGAPYFNRNLVRHIKLVGDFDELVGDPTGEDPLLQLRAIQDRDVHVTAQEMLHLALTHIDEFYREALQYKDKPFVAALSKALMALMLAANGRNLIQNTTGKSCISYYRDFHTYLREALLSSEYHQAIAFPPESGDRFGHALINLSHALCCFFFLRVGMRSEIIELIHRLIEKGAKGKAKSGSPSIWESLLDEDEHIRYLLKRYPSGPLMKTLDLFREEERELGYDPLQQDNLPRQLFTLTSKLFHTTCLHLPSPTQQEYINKVEVVVEFRSFLRALKGLLQGQKHLLINLQDRTSWQEHTRADALEKLQKEAEFSPSLLVVTLPKNTDFYLQAASYLGIESASDFIAIFKEQIASGEQCGFFFPAALQGPQWEEFIAQAMREIHTHLFEGKKELSRTQRLDFIEIFYALFCLKIIEVFRPDSLSFTCKDGVDTGAAATAGFFALLRQLAGKDSWSQEEKDFLLWMLYTPALTLRERAIDLQRLSRTVHALSVLQLALVKGGVKKLLTLFAPELSSLKVEPASS